MVYTVRVTVCDAELMADFTVVSRTVFSSKAAAKKYCEKLCTRLRRAFPGSEIEDCILEIELT
jgi:hypothetical protein